MTNYKEEYDDLESRTNSNGFVGVSNEWISLENNVMTANTTLITNIFGDTTNDSDTGSMLDKLNNKINDMFLIKNDSLTNSEMNENNKYKYNYNLVYLILKIFVFLLFIYVGVKLLRGNNISTEGITTGTAAVISTTGDILNKTKKTIKESIPKKVNTNNNKNMNLIMNMNNNNSKKKNNLNTKNNTMPLNNLNQKNKNTNNFLNLNKNSFMKDN